jgi:N-acetyl-alpha-D-glucosaminyl L-malate synthase BshA
VQVAREFSLDIIHAHYAVPHATAGFLSRQVLASSPGVTPKVVTTLHGTDITLIGNDPSYSEIVAFSIEQSDAVTAVSKYLRDETFRAFGCSGCGISVVPNFVDPADFHGPRERCPLFPAADKVLMHISNMRPVKRLGDVISIFDAVRKQIPARLVLAGDGPDRENAEREVERLGLKDRVRFIGKVEDVAQVMRWAHLFLLPSQSESFGLSALEALATGVPVIGARVGGLPEVVEHGVSGYLGEPGNVAEMAAGALALLADESRYAAASAAARERAGLFATDKVVPMYEEVYAQVVDG